MDDKLTLAKEILDELFNQRKIIQDHTKDLVKKYDIRETNQIQAIYDFAMDMYMLAYMDAFEKINTNTKDTK